MNILRIIKDILRIAQGVLVIMRYCLSKDAIFASLSLFSANSSVARKGEISSYEIILANNSAQHSWFRLLIDIYLKSDGRHPKVHYACFEKKVFVRTRESQRVEIAYNWNDVATFAIDEIVFFPDSFWRGDCDIWGKYFVRAVLWGRKGEPLEKLTLIQELTR